MRSHVLTGRECVAVPVDGGSVLRCTSGQLWLTFEPATAPARARDEVLAEGGDFRVARAGVVFVSPLGRQRRAAFSLHEVPRVADAHTVSGLA